MSVEAVGWVRVTDVRGFDNTALGNTGLDNTGLDNTGLDNTGLDNTGLDNAGLDNAVSDNTALAYDPPSLGKTVVIGCGNLLRGDDAVGPVLIRSLWTIGIPDHVVLVDGGTAGMDVGFKMQGARRVILVDAAATGSAAGTIFKVPGAELEHLPPLAGLHSHQFRWDHSLAFARWLLKTGYPDDITVFLIEAESCTPGADLTPQVDQAMRKVARLIIEMWDETAGTDAAIEATHAGG